MPGATGDYNPDLMDLFFDPGTIPTGKEIKSEVIDVFSGVGEVIGETAKSIIVPISKGLGETTQNVIIKPISNLLIILIIGIILISLSGVDIAKIIRG